MTTSQKLLDWLFEQLGDSSDIMTHELEGIGIEGHMFYIKSVCDEKKIQNMILKPFVKAGSLDNYIHYLCMLPEAELHMENQATMDKVLHGYVVLFFGEQIYLLNVGLFRAEKVPGISVEGTIQGPINGLSEDIVVNLNLIRTRYPRASLRVEEGVVGTLSQTKIAMIYDEQITDPDTLQKVKEALSSVQADVMQAAGQLHLYLTGKKRTLFPTMLTTERPDRIIYNLSRGKIIFIMQGTPFSLIVPAVFYDFMSAMDDFYTTYWVSRFLILLRYIGLFSTVTLAGLYVAVTSYNPELLRVQLAFSIAGSRAPVPYPSYVEVLFMLLMMELLTEASLRLPKSIGATATTVGGLILGQAATQAGLVSNIMIIIVSSVAISNYVIPIIAMSYGVRVVKYGILLSASLFGLMGLLVGIVCLICYLVNLESFGQPYLKLFVENPKSAKKTSGGIG